MTLAEAQAFASGVNANIKFDNSRPELTYLLSMYTVENGPRTNVDIRKLSAEDLRGVIRDMTS